MSPLINETSLPCSLKSPPPSEDNRRNIGASSVCLTADLDPVAVRLNDSIEHHSLPLTYEDLQIETRNLKRVTFTATSDVKPSGFMMAALESPHKTNLS